MATLTASPDTGNPGTSTVDGLVARQGVSESLAVIRAGNGTAAADNAGGSNLFAQLTATGINLYQTVIRSPLTFDTSSLSGATLTSAKLRLYVLSKSNGIGNPPPFHVVAFTPSANNQLIASDYQNGHAIGSWTSLASLAYASITTSAYNEWTLDVGDINQSGVTALSIVEDNDFTGTLSGAWANGNNFMEFSSTEAANKPELVVEYEDGDGAIVTSHTSPLNLVTRLT